MSIESASFRPGSWVGGMVVAASLFASTIAAEAGGRVALVVGNSAYRNVPTLPNPIRDARAVKQVLEEAKFDVVQVLDATAPDLRASLDSFAAKAADADEAVVYFAGHAVQMKGANHLLPVDLQVSEEGDIVRQSLSLDEILKRLDATKAKAKIVILDACRDNPFMKTQGARGLAVALTDGEAERGIGSETGLARVASKGGTFVAFSTSPGATAADGSGDHSPYTAAFLKFAREPGLPVEQLFRQVRASVDETTSGAQLPWETSSLTSSFTFFAGAGTPANTAGTEPPKARPTEASLREGGSAEAYRAAILWDDPVIYRQVLAIHPDEPQALRVHRILALRLEEIAWASMARSGTAEDLRLFLGLYPTSAHAVEARALAAAATQRATPVAALCPAPKRAVLPAQPHGPAPKAKRAEVVKPAPAAPKPAIKVATPPARVSRPPIAVAVPARRPPVRVVVEDDDEDVVVPVLPRRPVIVRPPSGGIEPDFPRRDPGRDWPRTRPPRDDGGRGIGLPFPQLRIGGDTPSFRDRGGYGIGSGRVGGNDLGRLR